MNSSIAASTASHHLSRPPSEMRAESRSRYASTLRIVSACTIARLSGKELIDRTDRHLGPLGQQGRGQAVVAHLVDQLGTGVEHPVHPGQAATLYRHAP
jgi:hypothetical protein